MSNQQGSNKTLYFLAGVILVAVLGVGYVYYTEEVDDSASIETSAGDDSFKLEVDDDSLSVSSED